MSFRGVKRRGNPLKRNVNTVAIATNLACFRDLYRAENLCYQFKQGQKLPPQFRQIFCLVKVGRDTRTRCITVAEDFGLFEAYLYTQCAYSKTEHEPQGGEKLERRAFVAHKLLLLQPQQVVVVRLGSLCSSSHTAKNFAFIFDMQALVRLFLPCGSPCVRSTSDCAVLLRS